MGNPSQSYELSEREIASLHNENSGSVYHRINTIRARCFDAAVLRAMPWEKKSEF